MTYATPQNVEDRLGRPLTPDEEVQVTEYLKDAEAKILGKLPDALTHATADPIAGAVLLAVEVSITLRAARLTDTVQAAYPSTEGLAAPPGQTRANVTILDTEWRALGMKWYTSFSLSPDPADRVYTDWELEELGWIVNGGWTY